MRISTLQIYSVSDIGMRNAQSAINKTSEQMSAGKRLLTPADDPVAASSILRLTQHLGRIEQYEKNISAAQNSLDQEEVALQSVNNLMQRVKELAVRAGNTGTMTPSDYDSIAAEVESRLGELFDLQNTRNASGQYIFSGHQGSTQPFTREGSGKYVYQGDEGQMRIQVSETGSVAVSDSGKNLFVDIPSGHSTFNTRPSAANQAVPPARIDVGEIIDQDAYEAFYPRDMKITFNAPESVSPAGTNYTITDDRGRVLAENVPYEQGEAIEINGARVRITGQPYPGEAATPATMDFGAVTPVDFTGAAQSVTLTVGGKSETLVLDRPVNNAADLAAALSATAEVTPGSGADRNAQKLANLGLTVSPTGLEAARGQNITVRNGTADTDQVFGVTTQNQGTTSTNGELATPGDSFVLESSNKQGLLTTVSRFSLAMQNLDGSPESIEALNEVIAQTIDNIDRAETHLTSAQGELGARMNTLESSQELLLDTRLHNEEVIGDLEGLDYAEATTRLQMQSLVLSAAQQTFVKVANLNLFNYL